MSIAVFPIKTITESVDGWCNKSDLLVKAFRANNLGMRLMIDFHYSDTWTDPGQQTKPAAWADMDMDELQEAVADHTRDIRFIADKGFFLNGQQRKFQGVCNHHDLGPLGAAINEAALRRHLTLLKEMGCDAIRTSHNMPAPELVKLCDEMDFMMIVENFDEWDVAKCKNGYYRFFDEWAEKDMVNR